MDRRRGISKRPVSSEGKSRKFVWEYVLDSSSEIECWSHARASVSTLSGIYENTAIGETIGRVNRFIAAWPADDTLPAEGIDSVKTVYKKLSAGLHEIRGTSEKEAKYELYLSVGIMLMIWYRAIDDAIENVSVLIALRSAPESLPPGN